MKSIDPTVRRQEVGAELRSLRKKAHFTLDQASQVINVSPSKLSRIETGHRKASSEEVSALLAVYGADHKKRDRLLTLTRQCDEIGWWQRNMTDHAERRHTLITLESQAESIVSFDLALIPGILQTGEYARAVISESAPTLSEEEIEDRMVTRLRRQSILARRDPPKLITIIDELALHRFVAGREILRRQLEHLVKESGRPNVTVHIVPNDGHVHPGVDGSFLVLYRSGFSPVVYADTLASSLFMEERIEIDTYDRALQHLLASALDPAESIELVASLARQLETEAHCGWSPPTYTPSPGERAATVHPIHSAWRSPSDPTQ